MKAYLVRRGDRNRRRVSDRWSHNFRFGRLRVHLSQIMPSFLVLRSCVHVLPPAENAHSESLQRLNCPADGTANVSREFGDRPQSKSHTVNNKSENDGEIPVWKESQENCPGKTADRTSNADGPLNAVQGRHAKGHAPDEDDQDLAADHEAVDSQKPIVLEHAFEDVEVVVQSAVVELVENLHPDKRIEDDGVELEVFLSLRAVKDISKDLVSGEIEGERHSQLIDRLADNHFPHGHREQRCTLWDWLSVETLFGWSVGRSVINPVRRKLFLI